MTHGQRKLVAIAVLVLGVPAYIAVAAVVLSFFDRPPFLLEIAVYVVLGVAWALPLRRVFLGVGRAAPPDEGGGKRTDRDGRSG